MDILNHESGEYDASLNVHATLLVDWDGSGSDLVYYYSYYYYYCADNKCVYCLLTIIWVIAVWFVRVYVHRPKVKVRLLFKLAEATDIYRSAAVAAIADVFVTVPWVPLDVRLSVRCTYDKWRPYIGVGGRDYSRFCIHFRPPAVV